MALEWDMEIADLLTELSAVQKELLEIFSAKRDMLRTANLSALDAMQPREQAMIDRLQACHDRRAALLENAKLEGSAATTLTELAGEQPNGNPLVSTAIKQVAGQARLLQHQSLANWVFTQRTLIHLSQLLEIIATGGRARPTYGVSERNQPSGALVDQAA